MQHESRFLTVNEQIASLNRKTRNFEPPEILEQALKTPGFGQVALVSSFGAESIVLLHMVSLIDKTLPVIFIDSQLLFKETLSYQTDVAAQLGLSDVRRIHADASDISKDDPNGTLNARNKDACCALRKTRPLQQALHGFGTWITGRKRFQAGTRSVLEAFEVDEDQRVKVNPLAAWQPKDLQDYITAHHLPRHPLVSKGFASIGCAPCTSAVKPGEDARAGRWRDSNKTECGIHFPQNAVQKNLLSKELSS